MLSVSSEHTFLRWNSWPKPILYILSQVFLLVGGLQDFVRVLCDGKPSVCLEQTMHGVVTTFSVHILREDIDCRGPLLCNGPCGTSSPSRQKP